MNHNGSVYSQANSNLIDASIEQSGASNSNGINLNYLNSANNRPGVHGSSLSATPSMLMLPPGSAQNQSSSWRTPFMLDPSISNNNSAFSSSAQMNNIKQEQTHHLHGYVNNSNNNFNQHQNSSANAPSNTNNSTAAAAAAAAAALLYPIELSDSNMFSRLNMAPGNQALNQRGRQNSQSNANSYQTSNKPSSSSYQGQYNNQSFQPNFNNSYQSGNSGASPGLASVAGFLLHAVNAQQGVKPTPTKNQPFNNASKQQSQQNFNNQQFQNQSQNNFAQSTSNNFNLNSPSKNSELLRNAAFPFLNDENKDGQYKLNKNKSSLSLGGKGRRSPSPTGDNLENIDELALANAAACLVANFEKDDEADTSHEEVRREDDACRRNDCLSPGSVSIITLSSDSEHGDLNDDEEALNDQAHFTRNFKNEFHGALFNEEEDLFGEGEIRPKASRRDTRTLILSKSKTYDDSGILNEQEERNEDDEPFANERNHRAKEKVIKKERLSIEQYHQLSAAAEKANNEMQNKSANINEPDSSSHQNNQVIIDLSLLHLQIEILKSISFLAYELCTGCAKVLYRFGDGSQW